MTKTAREKMLTGELYLASDPELVEMTLRAQRILHDFNQSQPDAVDQRRSLIQALFKSVGPGCEIKPPFCCDYGSHIAVGNRVFVNYGCVVLDCAAVKIGDRTLLGPKVQIYTASHPLEPDKRKAGWEFALPVEVGNDVWLGGGAIVCPGVTIGAGATIGAGSVVTKDVPAGVLAVGNPCQVVRQLPK